MKSVYKSLKIRKGDEYKRDSFTLFNPMMEGDKGWRRQLFFRDLVNDGRNFTTFENNPDIDYGWLETDNFNSLYNTGRSFTNLNSDGSGDFGWLETDNFNNLYNTGRAFSNLNSDGSGDFGWEANLSYTDMGIKSLEIIDGEIQYFAQDYFDRVESNGGTILAPNSIDQYIKDLISNGLWDSITSKHIFSGVDLIGCFVPLKGNFTLTNNGFESTDQNEVGLKGDGFTKHITTNISNNILAQNNHSASVFITEMGTSSIGNVRSWLSSPFTSSPTNNFHILWVHNTSLIYFRSHTDYTPAQVEATIPQVGLIGLSRNNSSNINIRLNQTNSISSQTSIVPSNFLLSIFNRTGSSDFSPDRILTYVTGTNMNLELLETIQNNFKNNLINELT